MKKRKRMLRVGDQIKCRDWEDVTRKINDFARRGVDAKPTGEGYTIEIVDIDRRKK